MSITMPIWNESMRRDEVEQRMFVFLVDLNWLVKHAKIGDIETKQIQEIKDNIKILEAKCNG